MTTLIDLTHIVTDNMPTYPGDPCAKLYSTMTFEEHGFRNERIDSSMHVGTHMDAPIHMLETGDYVADIPLGHFQGRGVLIDARNTKTITADYLHGIALQEGDIVMVWTGWSAGYRQDGYFDDYPVFSEDFAHALVKAKIKLVAMDTPSPDCEPFAIHKILLKDNVLIVENADNLSALEPHNSFIIHAYPAKYKASGAPVRLFAEVK